jgi:hypothetical protein
MKDFFKPGDTVQYKDDNMKGLITYATESGSLEIAWGDGTHSLIGCDYAGMCLELVEVKK